MENKVFAYICPNCHKPITTRLEKFKCWYCNTYYEDTSAWEIKEYTETELNNLQGKVQAPVAPTAPVAQVTQPPVVPTAASSAPPKTEEMLKELNDKPWEFKWEKLAYTWQAVIGVLVVICILAMFIEPTPRGFAQTILGLIIGWFWIGPWCWKLAYEKGRNQTWAYAVGLLFGIPGGIVYWIYTLFFKPVKVIPIQ